MADSKLPVVRLERDSFIPFYRQIAAQLRDAIKARHEKAVGTTFWSEGELAEQLRVSKMTVRKAFEVLRGEGYLVVQKGRRPVIGAGRVDKNLQELRGFSEEMVRRGMTPSSKLLSIETREPDASTMRALRLQTGENVFCIRRLRIADGELYGVETTHLPVHLFHGLEEQNLGGGSLYSIIEGYYGLKLNWSEEEIQAVIAKKSDAVLLQVPVGFPLLSVRRTVYDSLGSPVEQGLSLFRGDRYGATVVSRRKAVEASVLSTPILDLHQDVQTIDSPAISRE